MKSISMGYECKGCGISKTNCKNINSLNPQTNKCQCMYIIYLIKISNEEKIHTFNI